ncbi:MAG: response regulator [Eubacterium sp.]|nr:response regulator [Eubacterium sp.]
MNKIKKQGLLETSVMTVKVVLCLLFVFNAFVFIYYGLINRSDVLEGESVSFFDNWTVSESEDGDYSVYSTLPENIKDNEYLFFITRKDAAAYINGELRKDFIEKRDVNIPGGTIKRFYMMVPLKTSDSGAEIKIVRLSELKDEHVVPKAFIGTRYAAFSYLIHSEGISLILAAIVLIFSIAVIIVSFVLEICYKTKIDMMYGALGIFVLSSWIITDMYLFPFLFGVNHVSGLVSYMLCHMIPFAPSIYLNSLQRGRYKKFMSVMMIAFAINAIIWPVLHFTGVLPYYNTRTIMNLILVAMAVAAIGVLLWDAIKGNVKEYRYTFFGFFGFIICGIVQLILLLLGATIQGAIPMVIGLGVLLTFVVIQQVDDLRKINMEKQRAIDISEAKTRFLASMSHEIRTPINAILGMNEMILRENNDKVIGEYSRSIKSSGNMLLMLVNDVLDFSKIEAGMLEINETRFFMSDMLYDVISLVRERADEKSLELTAELTDEIPNELISDEFRIRQILVNLITNAVKYTEKGSVALILGGSYTDDGFDLNIKVKDTGKGIRKEDQENLFDAFSRADTKANANIEGTGLGLAIVKSIVESMNGSLGVESEYGEGSEFWVNLPVKYNSKDALTNDFMKADVEYDEAIEECDFTAPDAKVLAVDDNKSNLTIVRLFLKRTGIKPDLCSSGTQAIELCKEKKYDLLLLDHMMPQPDGIETLHIIREDKDSLNKDTKAVVLTANAVAGSRQKYIDEGFDDYLTKPLDSKLLEQTVKNMLPEDKVLEVSVLSDSSEDKASMTGSEDDYATMSSLKKRLTSIKGLDYEMALGHCADDEELLEEIVSDVASECGERVERMKKNLEAKDYKAYEIDAHTIKSTMATLGLKEFSERAKKHEFAAKENDLAFICSDAEEFIDEYVELCRKLKA